MPALQCFNGVCGWSDSFFSLWPPCAVCDWDAMELMWEAGFRTLSVDSKSQPLLVSDNNIHVSTQSQREKHVEMLFESFDVPALYLARSAVLAAYVAHSAVLGSPAGRMAHHACLLSGWARRGR